MTKQSQIETTIKNQQRHPNQIRPRTPNRDFHKKYNWEQTKQKQKQDEWGKTLAEDLITRDGLN